MFLKNDNCNRFQYIIPYFIKYLQFQNKKKRLFFVHILLLPFEKAPIIPTNKEQPHTQAALLLFHRILLCIKS